MPRRCSEEYSETRKGEIVRFSSWTEQGRILGIKPLLSIQDAFAKVRHEESRRRVMLKSSYVENSLQNSALAAKRPVYNQQQNQEQRREKKDWRDYCKRFYHTKENCWKINGKPTNWQPRHERDGNGREFQLAGDGRGFQVR